MAELWPGGPLTLPHRFTHDGTELEIPALPVNELLYWLSSGQWWQLYPNAVSDEQLMPLRARLFDPADDLDLVHLHAVSIKLFGRLAGVTSSKGSGWWPAVRLAHLALSQWPLFNAWCVQRGVSPLQDTLMTAIGASYAWLRDGLPPESVAKLEQELWSAPPAATPRTRTAVPGTPAAGAAATPRTVPVAPDEVPEHIRQEEAGAFLAALGEAMPGQQPMGHAVF